MQAPPGLGAPTDAELLERQAAIASEASAAVESIASHEVTMGRLMKKGDHAGVLATMEQSASVNVRMINMAFTAQLELGKSVEAAAVDMLLTCEKRKLTPSAALHNNVLAALARREPPQLVLSWLARMRASNVQIDRVACNIELKAHLTLNDLASATKLLFSMLRGENDLPKPDAASFNTLINALSATQPQKAEGMLTTMLDTGLAADKHSYTSVIGGFAKACQPSNAAKWLERMIDAGVTPDTIAFNTVLNAFAAASDVAGCRKTLAKFEERSFEECPSSKPDLITFNTYLSACARGGSPKEAEAAFERLTRAGVKYGFEADQVSYATVLAAHARAGHVLESQRWLDRMTAAGIVPDTTSYNTVCSAHARVGDAAAALGTFQAMERSGVKASATTHSIMINALVQAGDLDRAEEGLMKLVASGERLSASSFNTLISSHAKSGRADRGEALISTMAAAGIKPSIVSFNSLASAYAAAGNLDECERVVGLALARKLKPDGFTYGALLQACIKSRGSRSAVRERATQHAAALLASGVELNDFLASTCKRALGDAAFAELSAAQSKGSAATREPRRAAPEVDEEGWVTPSPSRGKARRMSKELASLTSPRSSGIKKVSSSKAMPKASTALAAETPDVRLVNVPLTRSKSDRNRLLRLSSEVLSGEGLPLSRTPSQSAALGAPVPLTRSAASELAITLGNDMSL